MTVFGDRAFMEVIKVRLGQIQLNQCPYKKRNKPESFCALTPCHVRTQWQGSHPQARKKAITRIWPGWHTDLGLPVYRTTRKRNLLFKLPDLWYVVIAAWADKVSLSVGHFIAIPSNILWSGSPGSYLTEPLGEGIPGYRVPRAWSRSKGRQRIQVGTSLDPCPVGRGMAKFCMFSLICGV